MTREEAEAALRDDYMRNIFNLSPEDFIRMMGGDPRGYTGTSTARSHEEAWREQQYANQRARDTQARYGGIGPDGRPYWQDPDGSWHSTHPNQRPSASHRDEQLHRIEVEVDQQTMNLRGDQWVKAKIEKIGDIHDCVKVIYTPSHFVTGIRVWTLMCRRKEPLGQTKVLSCEVVDTPLERGNMICQSQ